MCKSMENAVKFQFLQQLQSINTKQPHGDWGWFRLIHPDSLVSWICGFVTFAPPDPGLGRTREGSAASYGDASFFVVTCLPFPNTKSTFFLQVRESFFLFGVKINGKFINTQSSKAMKGSIQLGDLKMCRSCVKQSDFVLKHWNVPCYIMLHTMLQSLDYPHLEYTSAIRVFQLEFAIRPDLSVISVPSHYSQFLPIVEDHPPKLPTNAILHSIHSEKEGP